MADDEVLDDANDAGAEDEEEVGFEEDLDEDLDEDGDLAVAVVADGGDEVGGGEAGADSSEDEEEAAPAPGAAGERARSEDEEDDDDEADPDDVEEDLDTILRDRITAGAEDEDDEDEAPVEVPEGADRVAPRAAEEHSCPECFLLVRRSQFSTRRTDCPGGLDGEDCPMKQLFS